MRVQESTSGEAPKDGEQAVLCEVSSTRPLQAEMKGP